MCGIICAAKRQKWQTDHVSCPPYDGAPFLIKRGGWVISKQKILLENISPLFKPKK